MVKFKDGTSINHSFDYMDDPSAPRYVYKELRMKKPIVAVYDKKIGLFDQPFVCRHKNEAVREWGIVKENKETKYGKNPEDFELYWIAEFDESTGQFENLQPHEHIASGVE